MLIPWQSTVEVSLIIIPAYMNIDKGSNMISQSGARSVGKMSCSSTNYRVGIGNDFAK